MLKPHARKRLWERHDVLISEGDIRQIGHRLAIAEYRDDPKLFRYLRESRHETSLWQANLEPYLGREMWVVVVWQGKPKRRVKTVLAVPANLSAEAATKWLETKEDRRGQGFGQRGPNQTPRDRRERKRA